MLVFLAQTGRAGNSVDRDRLDGRLATGASVSHRHGGVCRERAVAVESTTGTVFPHQSTWTSRERLPGDRRLQGTTRAESRLLHQGEGKQLPGDRRLQGTTLAESTLLHHGEGKRLPGDPRLQGTTRAESRLLHQGEGKAMSVILEPRADSCTKVR